MATSGPVLRVTTPLAKGLAEEIRRGGPISFEAFMTRCLYDPAHGYYAVPGRMVGRSGDFRTSVSTGPVFGELIAEWLAGRWGRLGCPGAVAVVEQGAHDGQLMADVLEALGRRHPACREAATPVVVEPLATRRAVQRDRLAAMGESRRGPSPRWVESLDEAGSLAGGPALFFANELLDAFPVDRWRFEGGQWHRMLVGLDVTGEGFEWRLDPSPRPRLPGMEAFAGGGWPDGYETETCPGLGGWVRELAGGLGGGSALVFDYGRVASDYFAPHRSAGTLRGYYRHRRCDDPFAAPGQTDLTADVNFSVLMAEAGAAGLRVEGPERQGVFLTRLATRLLLEDPPPDDGWRRQFLTLTHPAHLGHQFFSLVLDSAPPREPIRTPA